MGEHKFSKTAKPVAAGAITREEAVRMRMITNLAAILLERVGGSITLSLADLDIDSLAINLRTPDEGQTFIFSTDRVN